MSRFSFIGWALLAIAASAFVGCAPEAPSASVEPTPVDATHAAYLVESEPAGAMGVGAARESAKDDEKIVVVGRIGGSTEPFIPGFSAFTIVDPKVPYCSDDEGCPTPWDYCCEQNQVKDNLATVKLVDESGILLSQDARKVLGVKELSEVVIEGKADRDDAGNLVVLAEKVYVRN